MTTYGVVTFTDAEELDFVGPWEVFTVSAMINNLAAKAEIDRVVLVAPGTETVSRAVASLAPLTIVLSARSRSGVGISSG